MVLKVFIGYDSRQPVAFHVLSHSIWKRSSGPLSITPLHLSTLPIKRRGLTEFTYSRFLVPHLSDYKGLSLFMDSDMVCLADVHDLLVYPIAFPDIPVFVVKNTKRYEWGSLMVFNNALCTTLTPEYVEDPAHSLLDLKWASDVGELPAEWNHLAGYDETTPNPPKVIHYTQGIPCWPETRNCDLAEAWHKEARAMVSTVSFESLMGNSVHAPHVRAKVRQ